MSNIDSRKRRRTEKSVRFDIEHIVYIDTYSPTDYDRGGSLFTYSPIQYKINPRIPKLSLDIATINSNTSPSSTDTSSPDSDDSIETPTTTTMLVDRNKKKRKPKLTVNTSICTDGPLFFTKLSTNHFKHSIHDDDDDSEEDYLVPITPKYPTTSFTF